MRLFFLFIAKARKELMGEKGHEQPRVFAHGAALA
jgi:hypothetical protein